MTEDAGSPLARALALTLQMVEAATGHNWAQVTKLEILRQACLDDAKAQSLQPEHGAVLTELERHNRRLIELAQAAYQYAGEQLGQHQYSHRAISAYIDSSSSG